MSKRFQRGSVRLVGNIWKGRYWLDVPGEKKRKHPQVVLGTKPEMSKRGAQLKLAEIIDKLGLNKPDLVGRLRAPLRTFNELADAWIEKRLPQLALSTQDSAPKTIARYLRPFLGTLELESVKTATLNEWITGLVKAGLEAKTVHNLWKQFRAIANWHSQQNDVPKRAWYPSGMEESVTCRLTMFRLTSLGDRWDIKPCGPPALTPTSRNRSSVILWSSWRDRVHSRRICTPTRST